MTIALTKNHPRVWSINSGTIMVVTDLHGNWKLYEQYRDHFLDLRAQGKAECLIFTGDLIHSDAKDFPDQSVDIVLDVMHLRSQYGDAMIYLCGNHELPHIYNYGLAKGSIEYTPSFEWQMNRRNVRKEIIELFSLLPFYIRTQAGVSITHAGATTVMSAIDAAEQVFDWDHEAIIDAVNIKLMSYDKVGLRRVCAKLSQVQSYDELAAHYLAVSGSQDPRYDDLLAGFLMTSNPAFDLLYSALSTACEQEFSMVDYETALLDLLQYLSSDYATQHILISGHMNVKNGYQVVTPNHLRIASGTHSKPLDTARYLLFDSSRPIEYMENLLKGLYSIS